MKCNYPVIGSKWIYKRSDGRVKYAGMIDTPNGIALAFDTYEPRDCAIYVLSRYVGEDSNHVRYCIWYEDYCKYLENGLLTPDDGLYRFIERINNYGK